MPEQLDSDMLLGEETNLNPLRLDNCKIAVAIYRDLSCGFGRHTYCCDYDL